MMGDGTEEQNLDPCRAADLAIVLSTTPYLLQLDRRRHQRRRPRQRPPRTGICGKEIGDVGHQAARAGLKANASCRTFAVIIAVLSVFGRSHCVS
jgi:hypothetical protein